MGSPVGLRPREGSHSGLVRLLGEQVYPNRYREFKSHTLRFVRGLESR